MPTDFGNCHFSLLDNFISHPFLWEMSSKILIRKNHLSAYFGGSKETNWGDSIWLHGKRRTSGEVWVVAAFQGKMKQTESLAHSRGWEEEVRRTQEPVGSKVILRLPSGTASWTCLCGARLETKSSESRLLSPHHTLLTNLHPQIPTWRKGSEAEDPWELAEKFRHNRIVGHWLDVLLGWDRRKAGEDGVEAVLLKESGFLWPVQRPTQAARPQNKQQYGEWPGSSHAAHLHNFLASVSSTIK